jgi:hypothetical protein
MSCGIVNNGVRGPSFFAVKIVTANSYPDMLEFFAVHTLITVNKKRK